MKKFLEKNWLPITAGSSIFLLIVIFIVTCFESGRINQWELRFYIWTFMIFTLVMIFGVLRLYNSVVVNSSFLWKLKTSFAKLEKALTKMDTHLPGQLTNLSNSLRSHKSSVEKNSSALNDNTNAYKQKVKDSGAAPGSK